MKVLLSWLREFAPDIHGDPVELGEMLSGLGLAVEDMRLSGTAPEGVVLGRVAGLRPHPDASRIQLVDVDDGSGSPLQVCCGAFNMSVGDLIPLARVGTVMPGGLEIKSRRMRGQASEGMCCSAAELDMGDDAEGIMILNKQVTPGAELGAPLAQALGMEPDVLWHLEVNANRPDAMSVMGVARDLAAKLGVAFEPPHWSAPETDEQAADLVTVDIADPSLCGRFSVRLLRNVTIGPSPQWLARRLVALGMRPINNIVDLSNYVMLELGQPSHAFDLARLPGPHLGVRRAVAGETVVTIDGIERQLAPGDGVITDANNKVIGIAGVMGGQSSEISDATTDVLLEMAWWDPPSISRTVKRLNLSSEAAVRFRRGADWGHNIDRAFDRFASLAAEMGVTQAAGTVTDWGDLPDRTPLRVRTTRVNGLLGTTLSAGEMSAHLGSIGFDVTPVEASGPGSEGPGSAVLEVTIPTWRWDTATETDVAEEVARLHGYENIMPTVPVGVGEGGLTEYQHARRLVREVLTGAGCDEIQPMPFLGPGDLAAVGLPEAAVTLSNPLDANQSMLRTSLLPTHLAAVAYNQRHFNPDVSFFEIGHVYLPPASGELLPDEREHVAVALSGCEAPAAVELLSLLEDALALPGLRLRPGAVAGLHPTRSAEVQVAGRVRGVVGEVDPAVLSDVGVTGRVAWLELDLGALLNGPRAKRTYHPVSKFPPSDIDLAFVVDDTVTAADVERALRTGAGALLASLELFDIYRGAGLPDGHRSLAYRLRFQAPDRTLTDAEVTKARNACINEVTKRTGSTLRG